MEIKEALAVIALSLIFNACGPKGLSRQPAPHERDDSKRSIGIATMTEDGTIILDLRAEGPDGIVGHARFTYAPTDPEYRKILEHLGGLEPGEQKAVPPWPDKKGERDGA